MIQQSRKLLSYDFTLKMILGLGAILFGAIQTSYSQDLTTTTMGCYIKSGFQIFKDENQAYSFNAITPNGRTLCRSVGNNMYLIKFNGRSLYVEAGAVDRTVAIKPKENPQPLDSIQESTTTDSSNGSDIKLVELRRTDSQKPAASLAGQKIKILPGKWVPVRAEANQDSTFECPTEIVSSYTSNKAKSICSNVESIDQSVDLELTGLRVFDKDNKNWYVQAKFTHDDREFIGWFDEKQTTLNPTEEAIRTQNAAERTQDAWGMQSEIAMSSISEYKLDSTEIGYSERAKMLLGLQADPASFKTVKQTEVEDDNDTEHTTKFGPPVCGCIGRSCRVSSGYGPRKAIRTTNGKSASRNHRAWDISSGTGTPIVAISDGRIISAGWKSGWGRTIEVDHGNGLVVRYSHLNSYTMKSGKVKRGQQIATMGASGNVTGTHLDIGFKLNGVVKNPADYISNKTSFLNQSCGAVR